MFLLDDIALAVKGLAAVFRKVDEAARQEVADRENAAVAALSELHRQLETGQIDDRDLTGDPAAETKSSPSKHFASAARSDS